MGKLTLIEQTAPSGVASSGHYWADSTVSKPAYTDDSGRHWLLAPQRNWSTADQSPAANTDTYLTGSSLLIPSFGVQVGMRVIWYIAATKTAASTAAAVWTVRFGANQSTADTSRCVITQGTQSAAADQGIAQVMLTVRSIGAAGVIRGDLAWMGNRATGTGFGNGAGTTSAGFDTTAVAGQYIGLSLNTGASAAWTLTQVQSEIIS